ncbi:MAG TPA: ABC transporter ATP-binding protein [Symbiobacteriaceae bacterium]|nr:ABC transporter ATP-binding protein [Symbiobacteriaceae bacterium]
MGLLQTQDVAINFGGLWAVNAVDFAIEPGEVVGLIGPNGSGKTTFFNLLTGIYQLSRGSIKFKGQEIGGQSPDAIRQMGIARTFQSSRLCWNLSVLDNVMSGLYSRQQTTWQDAIFRPRRVDAELKAGIEKALEYLSYFNEDLVSRCYERVKSIPHIDRRRIEICRAMVSEPALILLDEPSAGLNPEETTRMMEDIDRIRQRSPEVSIIIIEHDMDVMSEVTSRVVVFNAGKKIAEGSFAKVAEDEEVIRAYLGGSA